VDAKDAGMKQYILVLPIMVLALLLVGCTITTGSTGFTDYNTGYTGYTVGYGSYGSSDEVADRSGTYVGYGGWASSFYAPGYRYGYHPM
jgi:hypothetical protein